MKIYEIYNFGTMPFRKRLRLAWRVLLGRTAVFEGARRRVP